jgi:hypothetical protein
MRKFLLALLSVAAFSCDRLGDGQDGEKGILCVSFDLVGTEYTRSAVNLPDTCDFSLTISKSDGSVVYDGLFGDCPESLSVSPGSYIIRAVSCDFVRPAFDSPQFGDEQCVVVKSGAKVNVHLDCHQLNAGVDLDISPDFLEECPDASLFLKSSAGKLMYSYSERRIAYFPPGQVSLLMSSGGKDEVLLTREMKPRDMLQLKVSVAKSTAEERNTITMSVDTSRTWYCEEYIIGESSGGGASEGDAVEVYTVAQAIAAAEKDDVWVSGYIVGGDLTSASASFDRPFKSKTNLLLGPRSATVDRSACVSVQLPAGDIRDALNLVDNPDLLRKRVRLRGDVVGSYYGLVGIKNVSEFFFYN